MIEYLDYDGTPISEMAFRQIFGPFHIQQPPLSMYRVVRMEAITGTNTFRLHIVDENGDPVPGIPTVFSWADGQSEGVTDAEGNADFPMGGGAWYKPWDGQIGPHVIALAVQELADVVDGIGMIFGTNHDHFNVTMRYGEVPVEDEVIALLELARAKIAEADAHVAEAIALLEVV